MSSEKDEIIELLRAQNEKSNEQLIAQKELIEATKAEALHHEKKVTEYRKLREAEEATAKEISINNDLMKKRIAQTEEVISVLREYMDERTIEKGMDRIYEILSGIRIIAEYVSKELLKRVYTELASKKEREELLNALINIGKSKPDIKSTINLSSEKDIATRDVIGTKYD